MLGRHTPGCWSRCRDEARLHLSRPDTADKLGPATDVGRSVTHESSLAGVDGPAPDSTFQRPFCMGCAGSVVEAASARVPTRRVGEYQLCPDRATWQIQKGSGGTTRLSVRRDVGEPEQVMGVEIVKAGAWPPSPVRASTASTGYLDGIATPKKHLPRCSAR